MTLQDFLTEALRPTPGVRKGQKFFNSLAQVRPELAAQLTEGDEATHRDPYYRDENIWSAVKFVTDNWNGEA